MKDRLARLAPAAEQALSARALRRERRRAEEQIAFQASLLDMFEHAAIAVDLSGAVTFWNRGAERLYGWTAAEVRGRLLSDLIVPPGSAHLAGPILAQLRQGQSWAGEFTVRRKDGSEFPAYVADSPIRDSAGRLVGIVGVSHDITGERQIAAALKESEERLRLVTDNILDMVSQVRLDGTFVYTSPSHETVLGYTPEALLGTSAFGLAHPEDLLRIRPSLDAAIRGRHSERFEFRCRHADGHYVDLEATGTLLIDAAGLPVGAVLCSRDISERKRLERDLQRRSEDLERFNRLAVGRELRMVELKQRVNELSRRLGQPEPFAVAAQRELADTAAALESIPLREDAHDHQAQ